jgi:hypothetical protein
MPRLRIPFRSLLSIALVASVAFGTGASRTASAQTNASDTAKVTELFKNGKAAFGRGEMAEAERLFSQAFAIRKSSDIAANLAQSELEQEKYRAAAEHFTWALANLLPSASDAQRKAVEIGLAKSRAEVAVLRLDIHPEGSDVLVAAQSVGKSPVAGGVFVDPGEVIISVKHEGFIAIDKRIVVEKGTEQAVRIDLFEDDRAAPPAKPAPVGSGLTPTPAPSSSDADRAEPKSLVPAYIVTGVAVAGGVTGLVFTLRANSKESDADELLDSLGPNGCKGTVSSDCDELKQLRESVDSSRNLAIGSFVVGGVAALVAGYLYWDALSHGGSSRAGKPSPRYGLLPSVNLRRGKQAASSVESVELGLSGRF